MNPTLILFIVFIYLLFIIDIKWSEIPELLAVRQLVEAVFVA